jgi:hypothetical protein
VTTSANQSSHLVQATSLQSHQYYTAPGTAVSALRRSCPTHRATGCLESLAAMPHTRGNWRSCRTPPLQQPRSATRRLPATRQLPSCRTAARQLPATAALLPANQHGCTTSAHGYFYQHTHHYINSTGAHSATSPARQTSQTAVKVRLSRRRHDELPF